MNTWVWGVLARPDADTVVSEARDWLADCVWRDLDTVEEAVSEMSDADVLALVERHCAGGLREFLRADPL